MNNQSNSTEITISLENNLPPIRYHIYIFVGLAVFAANALILLTILLSKELREQKQYVVIGGLALCDAVNGLACFVAGMGYW